jgi:hypothetical protein
MRLVGGHSIIILQTIALDNLPAAENRSLRKA